MSEKDNLQEADGKQEIEVSKIEETTAETQVEETIETKAEALEETTEVVETVATNEATETIAETTEATKVIETAETKKDTETTPEVPEESKEPVAAEDDAIEEIDASNAEEAEHEVEKEPQVIETKDYTTMEMDALVEELQVLVKHDNFQTVKNHVEGVKKEFNKKFNVLLNEKKEAFLAEGGNVIDFHFDFPLKKTANTLLKDFREKRQAYYKNQEKTHKENLSTRLGIIEEIKGLLSVEENINTTYKHFKDLQERWRETGPIPRDKYNNVWNNYHHHVENFYDFLHLNRDLRDLDFKHNLDKKLKIIERAEELAKDDNSNRSFRELQALHKLWKEELGPVAKEYRDAIWERFRNATKAIHNKRQEYYAELDKAYVKNLEIKHNIISKIEAVTEDSNNAHSSWQKKIKSVEALRQEFFNAGKVPIKVNEATWAKFKDAVRKFNRDKNAFYKTLKKDQYDNLQKKLELIKIAEANKESTDYETVTPLMKKIQNDWKQIGHVPRKESDKIWKQFKGACNHYFDKFHEQKNEENKEELETYKKKNELIESLKKLKFVKDTAKNLEKIKAQTEAWRALGPVPHNKRYIEGKFNKALNALYGKLDVDASEADLLKFNSKIESFASSDDKRLLNNELTYVRKRIDEAKAEINQLENNLQFFSNVNADNPLVQDVHKKIADYKTNLEVWQEKHKRIKAYY